MEDLARTIGETYSLEVYEIKKIKNAFKLTTSEGMKCFKASKYDIRQYSFIMKVLSYLLEHGFPCIPEINKTCNGDNYISYNGNFGFLCDWIESREADFDNPIDLKLCVESLAGLHKASKGFVFEDEKNIRYLFGKWIERFKKRCDELLYFKAMIANKEKKELTEFDRTYLSLFERHYRQALRTVRDLENSSYYIVMGKQLRDSFICHHDTANHNFLVTENLNTYIIDFDYCIFDTFIHDIGSLLIRNLKHGNWSFERMDYIMDIYGAIIPMDRKELRLTFCFMEFPQDFWQIGLQYYVEKKIWEEDMFMKRLGRISADMQQRNEFLLELSGRWGNV